MGIDHICEDFCIIYQKLFTIQETLNNQVEIMIQQVLLVNFCHCLPQRWNVGT